MAATEAGLASEAGDGKGLICRIESFCHAHGEVTLEAMGAGSEGNSVAVQYPPTTEPVVAYDASWKNPFKDLRGV